MTCRPSRNVFVFVLRGSAPHDITKTRLNTGDAGPWTLLRKQGRLALESGLCWEPQARLPSAAHCSLPSLCPCPCQGPSDSQEGQAQGRPATAPDPDRNRPEQRHWSGATAGRRRARTGCTAPPYPPPVTS